MREEGKLGPLEWLVLLLGGVALYVVFIVIGVEVALYVAEELVKEGV